VEAFAVLFQVGIPLGLILLGLLAGRAAEHAHLRSIRRREAEYGDMLLTDVRWFPGGADPARRAELVTGDVVIATDYFKTLAAGLRKVVGGELRSYETLLTRARREAVLRLLEDARARGYNAVCNLRLDTVNVGGTDRRRSVPMVELIATGTAYCRPIGSAGEEQDY
jgi:uncharacterized protein YbjQ (UPF0145 family)